MVAQLGSGTRSIIRIAIRRKGSCLSYLLRLWTEIIITYLISLIVAME